MTIKPLFAWYDLWIGVFWDQAKRRLYVLPPSMPGLRCPVRHTGAPQ